MPAVLNPAGYSSYNEYAHRGRLADLRWICLDAEKAAANLIFIPRPKTEPTAKSHEIWSEGVRKMKNQSLRHATERREDFAGVGEGARGELRTSVRMG
jgi:hypothetical protein